MGTHRTYQVVSKRKFLSVITDNVITGVLATLGSFAAIGNASAADPVDLEPFVEFKIHSR